MMKSAFHYINIELFDENYMFVSNRHFVVLIPRMLASGHHKYSVMNLKQLGPDINNVSLF